MKCRIVAYLRFVVLVSAAAFGTNAIIGKVLNGFNESLVAQRVTDKTHHWPGPKKADQNYDTLKYYEMHVSAAESSFSSNSTRRLTMGLRTNTTKSEGLKVVYASLDHCTKPEYLPEYRALCYKRLNTRQ